MGCGIPVITNLAKHNKGYDYLRPAGLCSSAVQDCACKFVNTPSLVLRWCCEIRDSRPERPQRPPRWRFGLTQLIAEVYADKDCGYHAFSFGVSLEMKRSGHFPFVPLSILRYAPFTACHSLNPMRTYYIKKFYWGAGLNNLAMTSYPHRMGRSLDAAEAIETMPKGRPRSHPPAATLVEF